MKVCVCLRNSIPFTRHTYVRILFWIFKGQGGHKICIVIIKWKNENTILSIDRCWIFFSLYLQFYSKKKMKKRWTWITPTQDAWKKWSCLQMNCILYLSICVCSRSAWASCGRCWAAPSCCDSLWTSAAEEEGSPPLRWATASGAQVELDKHVTVQSQSLNKS